MFAPLPDKPDYPALEQDILDQWERDGTFDQLRAKNAGGPRFSFIDGPVTANKSLGVHTAWGRTLKDVFQRYKAMRGFHQRYQNGFDCQGLWIEVGVERDLGLNSKREIEEFGLERFARECRARVEKSAKSLTEGSIRLGQWMDWENSYYTFSDTNIEYIWRFLRIVHERGWLYRGHRSTEWCPRCGTSISAHELVGSYIDREDPALTVRFPLRDRPGESILIWTTTPWTLPANVAAAVQPDAEYGLLDGDWIAVSRAPEGATFGNVLRGADMVGWRYDGPFDDLGPGGGVDHQVIPWDEVSLDEGTGVVHIAPGCGAEDFALSKDLGLAVLTPVDESGHFYADYGWLAGRATSETADEIIGSLRDRGLLADARTITHRYPECWRCHTPLIFRISDDWYIAVEEIREPMRAANREITWIPESMGKRMDDWLVNMGDWNISRRRYYGLPLPVYPCRCGEINVVGSKAELAELATTPLDGLEELRRPWIDAIKIRCRSCGDEVERVLEVGDVWLDAGIVPFSTLGWQNPEHVPEGNATGAARGLTTADLPDHDYWTHWFPADWVSEMREQVRLWFYAQLFMSVALTGGTPYCTVLGYEKMLDERGREMHGSWGNTISAEDAFARMGADVMRWQFCMQPPTQNLWFGFGPAEIIQRKLLTLWNSVSFFVQYANLAGDDGNTNGGGTGGGFVPELAMLDQPPAGVDGLDGWMVARTGQLVADTTTAYEDYLAYKIVDAFETYIDEMSNWYIRRSRRRFWKGDDAALRTLWYSLVQAARAISPVMPFLAEFLWGRLVRDVCDGAPPSVFLAGWPEPMGIDDDLLADVAAVRKVVELGRQARSTSKLRVRQPLRRMIVQGADRAQSYAGTIADELRVKDIVFDEVQATQLRVRPNLPVLGPRLGPDLPKVRKALDAGDYVALEGGSFSVAGFELGPDDVLVDHTEKEGWVVLSDEGVAIALDTTLDGELELEGRVNDTVHLINNMRKGMGLEITDRIHLALPAADADLLQHRDWIMAETLAVELTTADDGEIHITRAGG